MTNVKAMVTTPLSTNNYHLWSSQILKLFKSVNLDGFLSGSSPCPPKHLSDVNNLPSPNPQYNQWNLIDQNLSATLFSTISPPILPYILNLETTTEIWHTLLTRFQSSNRSRVMQLKNELHHLSLETNTITQYLSQVQTLVDHIAAAGCKIDNEDIILYVLNGLTPPYQPFKAAIRTHAGPLTLDELYSLLITEEIVLAEETNRELQASHTTLYSARGRGCWTVRGRGSRPPSSYRIDSSSSSLPVCQICSKVGHKASDCWHRTNLNIAPPTKPPRLQAFLASSLASNPEWVLDTGASSHLTPNYSQLTQPEPYQGSSSVQIGNVLSLPIAHSGNGILPTLTNNNA